MYYRVYVGRPSGRAGWIKEVKLIKGLVEIKGWRVGQVRPRKNRWWWTNTDMTDGLWGVGKERCRESRSVVR
jgi:hypothetical protein